MLEAAPLEQKQLLLALRQQQKRKNKSPYDFRDKPAWKLHDHGGLQKSPPTSHTLLTQIPGGSMAYRVCIDVLHTLDRGKLQVVWQCAAFMVLPRGLQQSQGHQQHERHMGLHPGKIQKRANPGKVHQFEPVTVHQC